MVHLPFIKTQKSEAEMSAEEVVKQAEIKAQEIINQATKKAQEVIDSITVIKSKIDEQMTVTIEHITQEYIKALQDQKSKFGKELDGIFPEIKTQYIQGVVSNLEDFKTKVQEEAKNMTNVTEGEVEILQADLKKKVDAEWEKIHQELEMYKKQKKESIDNEVINRVKELSIKVLADSIPRKEQEELIIKALEKAKREGALL